MEKAIIFEEIRPRLEAGFSVPRDLVGSAAVSRCEHFCFWVLVFRKKKEILGTKGSGKKLKYGSRGGGRKFVYRAPPFKFIHSNGIALTPLPLQQKIILWMSMQQCFMVYLECFLLIDSQTVHDSQDLFIEFSQLQVMSDLKSGGKYFIIGILYRIFWGPFHLQNNVKQINSWSSCLWLRLISPGLTMTLLKIDAITMKSNISFSNGPKFWG